MAGTKIAFLYSEVAGYFIACAEALSQYAEVLIVRWPTNNEAPFNFSTSDRLEIHVKTDYSHEALKVLVNDFNPDIVVCSGWMDKDYLKIVKGLDKKIRRVLSLDNHWNGSVKQHIASFISPVYLKRYFSHAWVPGEKQARFARKLGFRENLIKGFYCADTSLFKEKFDLTFPGKMKTFPKRFLYVARYVEHKGIFEMWEAFCSLQKEYPNDWELWCLGTGECWDDRVEHEKIKHFGFVQPKEMNQYIAKTGVYILPSRFEPWGVSVQEFAIAGFPLLLSSAVGSEERFSGKNSFVFEPGNAEQIKHVMRKVVDMEEGDLLQMGQLSHEVGMSCTTDEWANRILSII